MDQELKAAAQKLLDTCQEYYDLMSKRGLAGGVVWLTGSDGSLAIFTRGEYKDKLLWNIHTEFDDKRKYSFGLTDDLDAPQ
jgi:hypothetical protein